MFTGRLFIHHSCDSCETSQWVWTWLGLDGNPMGAGKLFQNPIAIEAAQARIFLTTKWRMRLVVDGDVVDVGHARLDL